VQYVHNAFCGWRFRRRRSGPFFKFKPLFACRIGPKRLGDCDVPLAAVVRWQTFKMTVPELERSIPSGFCLSAFQPHEPQFEMEAHCRHPGFLISAACSSAATRASISSISMARFENKRRFDYQSKRGVGGEQGVIQQQLL
jgi:hypothetical protein